MHFLCVKERNLIEIASSRQRSISMIRRVRVEAAGNSKQSQTFAPAATSTTTTTVKQLKFVLQKRDLEGLDQDPKQ